MSYFGCMGYENTSDLCLLTYCSPEMWIYNFELNSSLYFLLYQIKKTNFTYRREIDKFEQFVTCPRYNWWLFLKCISVYQWRFGGSLINVNGIPQ